MVVNTEESWSTATKEKEIGVRKMKHTAKVDIILLSCKLTPKNLKSYKKKKKKMGERTEPSPWHHLQGSFRGIM